MAPGGLDYGTCGVFDNMDMVTTANGSQIYFATADVDATYPWRGQCVANYIFDGVEYETHKEYLKAYNAWNSKYIIMLIKEDKVHQSAPRRRVLHQSAQVCTNLHNRTLRSRRQIAKNKRKLNLHKVHKCAL